MGDVQYQLGAALNREHGGQEIVAKALRPRDLGSQEISKVSLGPHRWHQSVQILVRWRVYHTFCRGYGRES